MDYWFIILFLLSYVYQCSCNYFSNVTGEINGLCAFIEATNIQLISPEWQCRHKKPLNPCSNNWTGIRCHNNDIISISIVSLGLTGNIGWLSFE